MFLVYPADDECGMQHHAACHILMISFFLDQKSSWRAQGQSSRAIPRGGGIWPALYWARRWRPVLPLVRGQTSAGNLQSTGHVSNLYGAHLEKALTGN